MEDKEKIKVSIMGKKRSQKHKERGRKKSKRNKMNLGKNTIKRMKKGKIGIQKDRKTK